MSATPGVKRPALHLALIGGIAAVILTLVLLRRERPTPSIAPVKERPSIAGAEETPPPSRSFSLRNRAGDRRRYRVRYRTDVRMELPGGRTASTMEAEGELTLRVYAPELHGLRFRPLRLSPKPSPEMQSELETETILRRDGRGRTQSIRFAKETSAAARNLLRGLIERLEVVLPAEPNVRWTERGADPMGRYRAEYRVVNQGPDGTRLARKKTYEEIKVLGSAPDARFEVRTSGEASILLDPRGILSSLEADESIDLENRGDRKYMRVFARSVVRARLLEACEGDPEVLAARGGIVLPQGESGFGPEELTVTSGEIRNVSISDLLAQLRASKTKKEWTEAAPRVFLLLKAQLEGSAEARREAAALLRTGGGAADELQLLADALGSTSTGWKELLELSSDADAALERRIVQALGLTPCLSSEVTRYLTGMAGGEGLVGAIAVGSLGLAGGRSQDPKDRGEATTALVSLLGGRRDAIVLRALGNIGSTEAFDAIAKLAAAEDTAVRAGVAEALRKDRSRRAMETIIRLASDSDERVRRRAVQVLAARKEPEARAAVAHAAKHDAHPANRKAANQLLNE